MDYSLQNLNRIGKLDTLAFQEFVEKLNLIGLEIDDIRSEKLSTNLVLENIDISFKIPANREDLLTEVFFIEEISSIFLFKTFQIWEYLKKNYTFILKQKYNQYNDHSIIYIQSEKKNVITYLVKIENCQLKSSPLWLIEKLKSFQLKSDNILNDIFTLVFYEWGQNINLLNLKNSYSDTLNNFEISYLMKKESYLDSSNNNLILYPGTIVLKLKNENKIISFLGNKNKTFLNENDSSFFLEATFYDIHKNSLLLNTLNTKISLKYLRQSFLENLKYSFQRILTLLEVLTSAKISNIVYRTKDENYNLDTIKILKVKKQSFINFLQISVPDILIFQKATLELVCETKKEYFFKIPLHRQDLVREIDIIEEYSRFIGYKNFQEISPSKSIVYTKNLFRPKTFVKNFFLNYGFNEIITNPINDYLNKNNFSILINNPLNNELSALRRSLIPKLLKVFEVNSRSSYSRKNFFEIGRTFKIIEKKVIEEDKLSGIFQLDVNKNSKKNFTEWFVAKGFIESFLSNFGYKNLEIQTVKKTISYFHPRKSILLKSNNKVLGIFGELSPILVKEQYSHVQGPIYMFELNVNYLKEWQINKKVTVFKEYSKFPSITKDLSLIINKDVNFNSLKNFIFSESLYLKQVIIFDIYFDENLLNKINITIRLEFQSDSETLKNDFIENEIEKIKSLIIDKYQLSIRI
jgi:phenylalanyl-tRNA synthetase beta chain